MMYKGYLAHVEYDDVCSVFSGSVVNTRTVITFQGTSVDELKKEFQASIEDYLAWCKEENIQPERPYSGRFNVRLQPETHQKASLHAKIQGISLNRFIEKAVEDKLASLEG